ncbi:XRE family transcriptional regulator [Ornithinimicrobium flavum]|uniref:XRE family transcriptional regulator n=1 Tax=Ornithinimicrobium flavum TaxID=1288636 RepID=UPI00106FDF9A|nr:XRE family transcriptional regulator [Ornithinimicrobium flavum]
MPRSIPALVEPSVLRWARLTIDLTEVAASRKLDLPDDRVAAWESGEERPTIAQLRKAAELYKRPLAVFFLPEPPKDFDTLRDFRRLAGSDEGAWSPALHDDFRRAHAQREAALELADLDDTEPPTTWHLAPLPDSDEAIASAARALLLRASPLALPGGGDRPYDHLNTWVAALEAAGVLVMATAGGRVPLNEMRAFSLYFDTLPVIVVNGADSPRGRLFSLLHEYAHLLLHTEGLCDMVTDRRAVSPDRRLEARCNALAAGMLLPASEVLAQSVVRRKAADGTPWTYEDLRAAAAPFGVSAEALLRRLVTLGRVSEGFYSDMREEFLAAYEADAARDRASGGNWYRNTVRDLGKGYVRQVTDAHRRRVIDTYTAATFLNVKASQLPRLAETAALSNASAV